MRYFDTHAHLNLPPLLEQADVILQKAKELGLMVNVVGVDGPSSVKAYEIALRHDNAVCSVAIHPNDIAPLKGKLEEHLQTIESLLSSDKSGKIVCVGETGLDASRTRDLTDQLFYLRKHIVLAEKFNKPLNLHCRDAHAEMAAALLGVKLPIIIHCFTAGVKEAEAYVGLGCFLSIPGVVTFKNALLLQEAVRWIPWEYLLVETDAPYLSPVPLRGKTNTPLHLVHTIAKVAELKGVSVEYASEMLFKNALRAFRPRSDI